MYTLASVCTCLMLALPHFDFDVHALLAAENRSL